MIGVIELITQRFGSILNYCGVTQVTITSFFRDYSESGLNCAESPLSHIKMKPGHTIIATSNAEGGAGATAGAAAASLSQPATQQSAGGMRKDEESGGEGRGSRRRIMCKSSIAHPLHIGRWTEMRIKEIRKRRKLRNMWLSLVEFRNPKQR